MSEQTETEAITCAVCERRLLPGERANAYISREGTEVPVCELCKSRAESAGWLRPDQVEQGAGVAEGRGGRRQRGELLGGLRRRVERQRAERRKRTDEKAVERDRVAAEAEAEAEVDVEREAAREEPKPTRPRPKPAPEQPKVRHGGVGGLGPAEVLAAFNESEHRRTIAGLSRSLGAPRATAIAIRTDSGHPGARITIAWELAWYQWEVGPGKRRPEIRQIAKGESIDQLRASDRNWNLAVGEDGSLSRRRAPAR